HHCDPRAAPARSTALALVHRGGGEWPRSMDGAGRAQPPAVGGRSWRSDRAHDALAVAARSRAARLDHPGSPQGWRHRLRALLRATRGAGLRPARSCRHSLRQRSRVGDPVRVALFVEGSENRAVRSGPLLQTMWDRLAKGLGVEAFSRVVPISKKHLVAMDPDQPPMSGAGESLDQLMVRCLHREAFDAAVVAWDLVPAWNPEGGFCRWQETLDLYRHLATSAVLDEPWRHAAT